MERVQKRVFALTWISYASYYLTRKSFAVAKGDIETDLAIGPQRLGDIDTAFLACYAGGQFLWGFVADRALARRVIAFGMLATAACALAFGLSSAFWLLLVLWGLNGVAQSTGWPANVKVMGASLPAGRRGSVMGVWTTCYQVGSLVANPFAAVFLVAFTWRGAFLGPALVVALVGAVIFFFLPDVGRGARAQPAQTLDPAEVRAARRRVLRTPLVWALGASYFFMKLTRYVLLSWLPYFMYKATNGLHYGKTTAASVALAFELGGFFGSVTVGTISERWLGGKRLGVSIVCLCGLAGALPLYAGAAPLGLVANFATLALVGFFLYGPDSLLSGAAAQDLGGAAAGATAAGVINGVGSLGPIAQGRLTSWISVGYGWGALFSVLGVGAIASALILVPFWWRQRQQSRT